MTDELDPPANRADAPRGGARAALPWLPVLGLPVLALLGASLALTLGACASTKYRDVEPAAAEKHSDVHEPAREKPETLPRTDDAHPRPDVSPGPEPLDEGDTWKAEPGYPSVPTSTGVEPLTQPEAPRAVSLGEVSLAGEPPHVALPGEVRIVVASVRSGKLASKLSVLRQLSRALGKDSGVASVVALARLDAQSKDPADLADLARVAARQEAHLLLVEARADDTHAPDLVLVVHPASASVLACSRAGAEPGPATEGGVASRLAALVRSVR